MTLNSKQLNPFELKTKIEKLLNKINSVEDINSCLGDFDLLDSQDNKKLIEKVLFKKLINATATKVPVICFLLEHFVEKTELINKLWETLKNKNLENEIKITILNMLRELDSDWSYESCQEYLEDGKTLLDEHTKQLLNSAIINPEVQIDFMDFLFTIKVQDKITLLNSLSEDFSSDALANILIPVFLSNPSSPEGKEALKLLAQTKSVLALHILEDIKSFTDGELLTEVKRSLSTIKISGTRDDTTYNYYKKILSDSSPHKCYATYPDGYGDMALIFTRKTDNKKFRFVSIVINVQSGIKDCFGFFEISEFEASKILERFLRNEYTKELNFESFKTILYNAELTTIINNQNIWKLPYEYVCWKSLLMDIDYDKEPLDEILENQVIPKNINIEDIKKITKNSAYERWFLDYEYSIEFQNLLKEIKHVKNLDSLIENNIDKVFTSDEIVGWIRRIIYCAYISFSYGDDINAELLFGLSKDSAGLRELFINILKRSVYEYLVLIKFNNDIERFDLTLDEINDNIDYIENRWVHSV